MPLKAKAQPKTKTVQFSDKELTEIKAIAKLALADADFFDKVASDNDLGDAYLLDLRDKLQDYVASISG